MDLSQFDISNVLSQPFKFCNFQFVGQNFDKGACPMEVLSRLTFCESFVKVFVAIGRIKGKRGTFAAFLRTFLA